MRFCCIVVLIVASSAPAFAQGPATDSPRPRLIISEGAMAVGLERIPPAVQSRDSLKNGAIIGAVIGAAVMGTGVGLLCKALQEPSDPSCWRSVATAIALGAGVGAAGGAGIDALFTRDRHRIAQPTTKLIGGPRFAP